jgi:hypothetical protein
LIWSNYPDLDKRLLELDVEGRSPREIAEVLSGEFGQYFSRDQVKNRLNRIRNVDPETGTIEQTARGFRVRIRYGHHVHTVGTFPSEEDAENARQEFINGLSQPKAQQGDCTIYGVTAEELPDFNTAFQRAKEEYQKKSLTTIRKSAQRLKFTSPYVCIVFTADQHIGNSGTDIERVFDEAQTISQMKNTYSIVMGDITDNYIVGKLQHLNFNQRQSIADQWVMAEEYLKILKPIAWVSGNHDGDWTQNLTGVDYVRKMVAKHSPNALYDTDDCRVTIEVAGVEYPARFRHKWRGHSIYNLTHGIERAQKWDQDFLLGVGAHTHASGLARQFNAGGRMGMAVLCGSYKRLDTYAKELGLPISNNSTAIAVLFDAKTQSMVGFDSLDKAANFMEKVSSS